MDDSHWREEVQRLRDKLAAEGKRYDEREKRCERNCMGYPAKDVRHWVAAEALTAAQEQLRLTHIDWVNTQTELTAAQARVEELERMVVWCARNGVWYGSNIMRGYLLHTLILDEDGDLCGDNRIDCDGTPASILAAVEKAMQK